jgi:hypothetical protein
VSGRPDKHDLFSRLGQPKAHQMPAQRGGEEAARLTVGAGDSGTAGVLAASGDGQQARRCRTCLRFGRSVAACRGAWNREGRHRRCWPLGTKSVEPRGSTTAFHTGEGGRRSRGGGRSHGGRGKGGGAEDQRRRRERMSGGERTRRVTVFVRRDRTSVRARGGRVGN